MRLYIILTLSILGCSYSSINIVNANIKKEMNYVENSIPSNQVSNLELESIKKFELNNGDFLLCISHNKKYVFIGIRNFELNGKTILAPIFTDNNQKALYQKLLKAPIFSAYNQWQNNQNK